MPSVWGTLGYDAIAGDIAQSIHDGNDINVVDGPPGVGKSWLARGIGALWESAGGSAVVAQGDILRSDSRYHPLAFALASLSSGWRVGARVLADTTTAAESLVGTAGLLTAAVRAMTELRPKRRRARQMYLDDSEQQILFQLEDLARRQPLLMIADNLHWWDPSSLEFLLRLRDPQMRAAFPFVGELRILGVETIEPFQSVCRPVPHDALLAAATTRRFHVPPVPRQRFGEVLEALGAPTELPAAIADAVYKLTGAHLALADQCVSRLAAGELETFVEAVDTSEFVARLLSQRLQALGPAGVEAVELLQTAAVLGLRFRRDEVTCAWGRDSADAGRVFRFLRDQSMVELSDVTGWFVHDLYRQHFLNLNHGDRTAIHERRVDCLRLLSPAEYELRSENAIRAERSSDASAHAVQAGLVRLREGGSWRDLPDAVLDVLEHGGMLQTMETFERAIAHLWRDEYEACLRTLNELPHALSRALLAEADALRAACLMSTRSDDDRARGRSVLDSWSDYDHDEAELGVRLMHLHLFGLTMATDKAAARALEGKINDALRRRVSFDVSAEDALYVLDRCAGSVEEPDLALLRTRRAVEYFAPKAGQTVVRRPIEYYRSLVNYAAECVVNARYSEAVDVSDQLSLLVDSYVPGVFPRLDHTLTTTLLAEYRLGVVDASDAARRQQEITESHGAPGDPFYPENARAVYLALAGAEREALTIYDQLLDRLATRNNPEPSMLYLLSANRCCVQYVVGERADVAQEWLHLDAIVRRVPYPIARFLVRRHELLSDVFNAGAPMAARQLDECLIVGRRPEFGPMWDQLGRGFRMPEVESWH